MAKRALCVGCNYPTKARCLNGAVNDAFLLADCLQQRLGFQREDIVVLRDDEPESESAEKVSPSDLSTRANILQQLRNLVKGARAGDVLFFSFSGYGVQVRDTRRQEDANFDEAILPTDFVQDSGGKEYSVIVLEDIHDILMGVPGLCSVTLLLDCDHATSLIDVTGTLSCQLVSSLKLSSLFCLQTPSSRKWLARHDRDIWQQEAARAVNARPRFQPVLDIEEPRRGRLPTRPAMSRSMPVAFSYCASRSGQTALEAELWLPDGSAGFSRSSSASGGGGDSSEGPAPARRRQHGVLSWSFVQALQSLQVDCTHLELLEELRRQTALVRQEVLPSLDQEVRLTCAAALPSPLETKVLQSISEGSLAGNASEDPSLQRQEQLSRCPWGPMGGGGEVHRGAGSRRAALSAVSSTAPPMVAVSPLAPSPAAPATPSRPASGDGSAGRGRLADSPVDAVWPMLAQPDPLGASSIPSASGIAESSGAEMNRAIDGMALVRPSADVPGRSQAPRALLPEGQSSRLASEVAPPGARTAPVDTCGAAGDGDTGGTELDAPDDEAPILPVLSAVDSPVAAGRRLGASRASVRAVAPALLGRAGLRPDRAKGGSGVAGAGGCMGCGVSATLMVGEPERQRRREEDVN